MDDEIRHPLAYARNERGWSQEELARRIRRAAERRGLRSGTRGSRIYKWETGRATPDEDESQPLIAEVFGIDYAAVAHLGWPHWLPSQDSPLPLGPHNAVPSLREALMTSLDRRSFLAYTSGSLAALAHQWAITEPGRLPLLAARGEVDAEMVAWLESNGAELIRLATERRQHTHRLLDAHLTAVTDLISEGRYTRPIEQRLHTLAAALSQAIAWQHFDERRHASAGRFWHAALHNAHAASQRDLGAGILSDLAYQLLWLQDARTASDILEYAIPRTRHPAARSLLHLRQARALAVLDEGGLCRRALTAAEKALDTPSYDPAPTWCSWMSHADLAADGGRCLADLGQPRQAHHLMDEGIALLPATRSKTRSVFLTYQAETYLRDGEPEVAAATATRSLDLASRIDAPRCVTMVRDLEPGLSRYAHTPGVGELLERLRAVG
ncbi:helix-turn-helix transcriptional regulator [Streptomyces alkaliterrae]|uniref:Helix-turn-helix transcriptional regulator n=1 Tax=Streptomyces alkaliterrae TaxID=2213162 RepID=A0A5P0YZR1_9ACTN|nr:helix-turn-helix transcriptional regulator [Streptomyces alkaliterrae]MBB1260932.1 helix-turn-helix transcriptional regulator [Streptomyces alkaliterrae]MQS05267.1 XRE family transcriptional regulator [Streptomyces alkaliterrae]